jgi:hypothetical protein
MVGEPVVYKVSLKNLTFTKVEGTRDDADNKDLVHLMKEWEEHMLDFAPDDFITFEVSPGNTEVRKFNYLRLKDS